MNHRSYPNVDRALAQIERHPGTPTCAVCRHPVSSHAVHNGERICTRGQGRISCRDCAAVHATSPLYRSMADFAAAFDGSAAQLTILTSRQTGRTTALEELARDALARGEHVHRASVADGVQCLGGGPRCGTPRQAAQQ